MRNLSLWRSAPVTVKFFVSFAVLSFLPLAVLFVLSLGHLSAIQDHSVKETRATLIASETNSIKSRLAEEAGRLSSVFTRMEIEAHTLSSFAKVLLTDPSQFTYRNSSQYVLDALGGYGNPVDDGNSVLFVPQYAPMLDPLVEATESLDLVMRPLVEREPRMTQIWIIVAGHGGVARGYPWRDFEHMDRGKDQTTFPFYFLADPEHNPTRGEVFTPPYLDPLLFEWMVSCLSPVFVGGNHVATVGFDVTVHSLLEEIRDIRYSAGSTALLHSADRIVAASENLPLEELGLDPSRLPHEQDLRQSSSPEIKALLERSRGTQESVFVEHLELQGRRLLIGAADVDPPGWKLLLLVPEDEVVGSAQRIAEKVLRETGRIRRNFTHVLVFALVGLLGLTWFLFAYQSRGLRAIFRGIHRLGKGDLAHRVEAKGGDFEQLANALNDMARGLLEKKRELDRVYAEVEQERKLSAVGRLAAGVAHEVNNPLATISTNTQMLLRSGQLQGEAIKRVERIMTEIARIQEKLRNLLDLSRLQSPVKTEMDPNLLIRDVVELARHEAAARGIELKVSLTPEQRPIFLDRSGIKQVLWNLLGNAIDAVETGGGIVVRSRFEPSSDGAVSYVIEVEDEGPGISEKLLPKIFEPFFTTKEVGQGTGLGLAVAYRVVQGHGGRIEAENLESRGCRFRVTLPEGSEG